MNCPRCSNPSPIGRRPRLFRLRANVPMEREGIFGGCQKWRCPNCRALIYEELPGLPDSGEGNLGFSLSGVVA